MYQEDHTTGSEKPVGTAMDPSTLIRFLDAARGLPALREAKQSLLDQLALGRARQVLDVGCGIGEDLAEMSRLMPDDAEVSGLDASGEMIAEARRHTTSLGTRVSLQVGDAANLPYPDKMFDACRTATVLQHVRDPARVVREMARVTRPGGRIGALEFDQGTTFLDHPDLETTRIILGAFTTAAVQGQMGRQLPRLFRAAGLTDVSVTPRVILGSVQLWRILFRDSVTRLLGRGLLTSQQTSQWWAELETWAQAGEFVGGAAVFVVTATRHA